MASNGYGGQILHINLTAGKIDKKPLEKNVIEAYIGGFGLAQKLMWDHLIPGTDPWAPEVPIVICPGYLNGTLAPSACKVFMTTKEPAAGTVSTWVGSLHFGARLKWAGYDGIVITGKSKSPVYLKIVDDVVEICDASNLWGRTDIHETVDALRHYHGNHISVATIGAAAENMVKISMVFIDKSTTWGRAAGSTWASKNLKAIAVEGKKGLRLSDMGSFMKIADKLITRAMKDPLRNNWKKYALYSIFHIWEKAGYMVTKNGAETASKEMMLGDLGIEEYDKRRTSIMGCPACIAPDKAVLEIQKGDHKGYMVPISTAIDPALAIGARLNISDMDQVLDLWETADRAGIDSMTFTGIVGLAVDLFERGIIDKKNTGGIEITEGFGTARKLLDLTIKNKGFGAIIASGFKQAIKIIGKGSEKYAIEVKGTEPDFDARASLGLESFTAQVNVRPCRDLPVGGLTVAKGRKPEFFQKVVKATGYVPESRFDDIFSSEGFNLPRLTAHYEHWACMLDMMGICFRMQSSSLWNVETVAALYSKASGLEKNPKQLLHDAERAVNLAKLLNTREGFDRKDDSFPERLFEPLRRPDRGKDLVLMDYFGKKRLMKKDTEELLSEYYRERGWDVAKGIPTREKLAEFDLIP